MVGLTALWLPIVLSAVIVFVASSVIHMVLRYHRHDYGMLPDEASVLQAMRKAGVRRGDYFFPHAGDPPKRDEATLKKFEHGPVGLVTIMPNGRPAMAKYLGQWFLYSVLVAILVAYVAGRTLPPGTPYLQVFRIAGTVTFLCYAAGEPIHAIWRGRTWGATFRSMLDGLIYGLLTGGVFGWLWPI